MKRVKIKKGFRNFALITLFSTTLTFISNQHVNADDNKLTTEQTTGKQQPTTSSVSPTDPANKAKIPASLAAADTNITTLMLKVTNKSSEEKATLSYTPAVDATDPYQGGELTGYARFPLEGDVLNRSILPINGPEHITNYEKGNYGARINIAFPEGVDARAMYQTIDWEKSNQNVKSDFYIKALGVPTPFHLTWGLTWDQSSVRFNSATPNEFSIMLRGIAKDKVSSTEWNKYNPAATDIALTAVGAIPGGGILGNIEGWAEGSLFFDINKYTGNTDDLSKDKILTKNRLTPAENRELTINISALDRDSLTAGTEGAGDISKALIIPGHEHDNTQTTSAVDTWSDYLSVWDKEGVYNTNTMEEPEISGVNNALPGQSIVNRDLVTNPGDDFNNFTLDRFNRVINYFTKKDVTKGNMGDVDHVTIAHLPTKVPVGETTPVTYSGSVTYYDGTTRQLMQNILNVTNSKAADYALTANDYTEGENTLTGTYGADVKEVHVYVNGKDVGTATLANGKYTVSGLAGKIKAGDTVTVAALNDGKKVKEVSVTVKESDNNYDYTLTANPYTMGENDITGTFGKDIAHVRLTVNGTIVKQALLNANGTYDLKGINGLFKKTDEVKVIGVDSNYQKVAEIPLPIAG